MSDCGFEPDESGFDSKLLTIAAEIVDDTMRGQHGTFGRDADVRSVFKAMQAHAAANRLPDHSGSLVSCRAVGRAMAKAKRTADR